MKRIAFISSDKEKEIIVWIRLQDPSSNNDKYNILDFIQSKLDLDFEHAETLYYKALPDGLSIEQETQVKEISKELALNSSSVEEVNSILDDCVAIVLETNNTTSDIISEFLELAQQCINLT